jgi:hypothetical protein
MHSKKQLARCWHALTMRYGGVGHPVCIRGHPQLRNLLSSQLKYFSYL